jgi:hypothetical protein
MSSSKVVPPSDHTLEPGERKPTSLKKVEANRRNARLSTGPRTEHGKRAVARNAIKHGLLAREVVITAGDGEEDLQEFEALLERLWQEYEPVGVLEETLVQRIATCWWRLARVLRAENGEIRKRLDCAFAEGVLRASDKHSLDMASLDLLGLGKLFSTSNETDQKLSGRERLLVVQKCQSDLRRNHDSVEYSRAVLLKVKSELASKRDLSEPTKDLLAQTFGLTDNVFVKVCLIVAGGTLGKDSSPEEASNEEPPNGIDVVIKFIDLRLKELESLKQHTLERAKFEQEAEARSLGLPAEDATDKLLRYEAHLDRQLYRAMDQLERLQRQRKGEKVPPPLNISLGRRD